MHGELAISCHEPLTVITSEPKQTQIAANSLLKLSAQNGKLLLLSGNSRIETNSLTLKSLNDAPILIPNLKREGSSKPQYRGDLEISSKQNKLQVVLTSNLESYLRGVLSSEIPASYHPEAIKAQAVTARTYALRPRIDHAPDGFNVCDSYLCCQYFAGIPQRIDSRYERAIAETKGQIITYDDKPILALFSACAGGHTENYENCFSDPKTGAFPPPEIPYLKGVSEGNLPAGYPSEIAMRALFNISRPDTCDGASSRFRWKLNFTANQLESHMHHVAETLLDDKLMAPFIYPPPSTKFGHIQKFEVTKRGVAGTAISLTVHTSTGPWIIKKELVIRNLFKNPELNVTRLMSARVIFDHKEDSNGLLSNLTIFGFGWGHGVGLQQHGAQGLALKGQTYNQIVAHYFPNTRLSLV